jgi:hypothetical protein
LSARGDNGHVGRIDFPDGVWTFCGKPSARFVAVARSNAGGAAGRAPIDALPAHTIRANRDLLALIAAVTGDYAADPNYARLVAAISSQTNV